MRFHEVALYTANSIVHVWKKAAVHSVSCVLRSRDCRGTWILECNEWQLFANNNYCGLQGSYLNY